MAELIDFGQIRFVHRGTYNAATTYEFNDVVTLDGSLYVYSATTPAAGISPTTVPTWNLMLAGVDPASVGASARTMTFLMMGS